MNGETNIQSKERMNKKTRLTNERMNEHENEEEKKCPTRDENYSLETVIQIHK